MFSIAVVFLLFLAVFFILFYLWILFCGGAEKIEGTIFAFLFGGSRWKYRGAGQIRSDSKIKLFGTLVSLAIWFFFFRHLEL